MLNSIWGRRAPLQGLRRKKAAAEGCGSRYADAGALGALVTMTMAGRMTRPFSS